MVITHHSLKMEAPCSDLLLHCPTRLFIPFPSLRRLDFRTTIVRKILRSRSARTLLGFVVQCCCWCTPFFLLLLLLFLLLVFQFLVESVGQMLGPRSPFTSDRLICRRNWMIACSTHERYSYTDYSNRQRELWENHHEHQERGFSHLGARNRKLIFHILKHSLVCQGLFSLIRLMTPLSVSKAINFII